MKAKHVILAFIMLVAAAGIFAGCSRIDGKIPNKKKVLEKVNTVCPTEEYELINVIEEDTLPKRATYYFKSTERELEFTAVSTLNEIHMLDASTGLYQQIVTCDYVNQVHELYNDTIDDLLEKSGLNDNRINISEYTDFDTVIDLVCEASEAYSKELKYNSEEWLIKNPYCTIRIGSKQNERESFIQLDVIDINGNIDKEQFEHRVKMEYATAITEDKLYEDSTIPQEIMDAVHVRNIDKIYVNGKLLTGEMANKEQGAEYNYRPDIFSAVYDYDFMDYLVIIDTGVSPVKCGPHPLAVYLNEVSNRVKIEYDDGKAVWYIDKNKYTLESSQDENESNVNYLSVARNGKDLEIHYTTKGVAATYLVAVPLKDLCKMIDCNVSINEKTGEIFFKSR